MLTDKRFSTPTHLGATNAISKSRKIQNRIFQGTTFCFNSEFCSLENSISIFFLEFWKCVGATQMRRCGKSFFNWKILKFLGDIGIILNVLKNWLYSIIKNRVNHLGWKFQNSRNSSYSWNSDEIPISISQNRNQTDCNCCIQKDT